MSDHLRQARVARWQAVATALDNVNLAIANQFNLVDRLVELGIALRLADAQFSKDVWPNTEVGCRADALLFNLRLPRSKKTEPFFQIIEKLDAKNIPEMLLRMLEVIDQVVRGVIPKEAQTQAQLIGSNDTISWSKPKTLNEWAKLFSVHRNTMRTYFKKGTFRAEKRGSLWVVSEDQVPKPT